MAVREGADNKGWVSVGIDHDMSGFAVNAIRRWCVNRSLKMDQIAAQNWSTEFPGVLRFGARALHEEHALILTEF